MDFVVGVHVFYIIHPKKKKKGLKPSRAKHYNWKIMITERGGIFWIHFEATFKNLEIYTYICSHFYVVCHTLFSVCMFVCVVFNKKIQKRGMND